jgi:hypothetical protein
MSRKLLAFLLSELKTVRITCNRLYGKDRVACGGIVEVQIERLRHVGKCPLCQESFQRTADNIPRFTNFTMAVQHLLEEAEGYGIEFVMDADAE